MTSSKRLAAVLACLLVTSLALPGAFAGATLAQEDADPNCQTETAHDAFLGDDAVIEEFNDSGSASEISRNTRVTIEETSAFYRVKAENPNSYCVHTTVSVNSSILPPTNLGTVDSNNEVTSASWTDVRDFDRQEAHTEITFTMPPNSTVLFAPSKPTVMLPAWRDEKKRDAQGILATVSSLFSEDNKTLKERTYTFTSDGSPYVTIPLVNEDDENQTITEWRAVYRTSESAPWDPVDKNTEAPVFYQEIDDGDKVRFYFNDKDAEVEFVANPTATDKVVWDIRSFKRSIHDVTSFWPFSMAAAPTLGGGAW